jgi:hypothetical protein
MHRLIDLTRHLRLAALLLLAAMLVAAPLPAAAQAPQPSEAVKNMVGAWELSNVARDLRCVVNFRLDTAGQGRALAYEGNCAAIIPALKDATAWTIGRNDALHFIDAKGTMLIEFTEVEVGMYDTSRAGGPLFFLQNLAAAQQERTADQIFGEWSMTRGAGRPICEFTFGNTAHDVDSFTLLVKQNCDQMVTRFAPVSWKLDRGQLVLLNAKAEAWRFEETEPNNWRRIPQARQPIVLVRQQQ